MQTPNPLSVATAAFASSRRFIINSADRRRGPPLVIPVHVLGNAARIFREMSDMKSLAGEGFRAIAYSKAASTLQRLGGENPNGLSVDALQQERGIGSSMLEKIIEISKSHDGNTLVERDLLGATPVVQSGRFLLSIHGFGPAGAAKIAKRHPQIASIHDLQQLIDTGSLKPTAAQLLGIKHYSDSRQRIPRAEVHLHRDLLRRARDAVDPTLHLEICGSYRRELSHSGDVDCLVAPAAGSRRWPQGKGLLTSFRQELTGTGYLCDVLGQGDSKLMGYCTLPTGPNLQQRSLVRRLDIRVVTSDAFPTSLLYFTGSGAFNTRMRGIALANGFSLNEYQLVRRGNPTGGSSRATRAVPVQTEQDIFRAIGMPFVDPKDRTD